MDFTRIVQKFAIDKLPGEQQVNILNKIFAIVHDRVGLRVFDSLTAEELKSVKELADTQGVDAALNKLESFKHDYMQLYQEELDRFTDEFSNAIFNMNQRPQDGQPT